MEIIEEITKKTAEDRLKRTCIRKRNAGLKEAPWLTEEVKREIKKKKEINRRKRREGEEARRLEDKYVKQKKKVQRLLKKEMSTHEEKITREIKEGKDKSKMLWENINKLQDKEIKKMEGLALNRNGGKLNNKEAGEELIQYWRKIYQEGENKIKNLWNKEKREEHKQELIKMEENTSQTQLEELVIPEILKEYMEMAGRERGTGRTGEECGRSQ